MVRWFCLFLSIVVPFVASAESIDTNLDGLSELLLVDINSDQSLTWRFNSSLTGAEVGRYDNLGVAGNDLVIANWLGSTSPTPGFVSLSGKKVLWKIRNVDGTLSSFAFGKSKDILISGADFNGNGYSDAGVIKDGKAFYIKYDPLSPTSVKTRSSIRVRKGALKKLINLKGTNSSTQFFFMNTAPSGPDWLASLKQRSGTTSTLRLTNPRTGKSRAYKIVGFVPTSVRPLIVRNPDGRDVLALIERGTDATTIKFRTIRNGIIADASFAGTGEIIRGNFTADPGQEIAIQGTSGFQIYNPFTGQNTNLSNLSGIAVDDININSLSGSSGGDGGGGGSCKNETRDPHDGQNGFLWKPVSDTQAGSVALMPASLTGKVASVYITTSDGTLIETGVSGGIGNGDRVHSRFSKRGSAYPKGMIVVAKLDAGCLIKYPIPNPSVRVD